MRASRRSGTLAGLPPRELALQDSRRPLTLSTPLATAERLVAEAATARAASSTPLVPASADRKRRLASFRRTMAWEAVPPLVRGLDSSSAPSRLLRHSGRRQ